MAKDKALKEWEKAFNGVLQEVAMEMQVRIETMYEIAIMDFYEQYEPISYIRTGATYYGSNKYSPSGPMGKSFFSNLAKRRNEYFAGIKVSSDYITSNWGGNPYRADTDWVFERTFVKGIHGNTSSERRKWGYLFKENGKNWKGYNLPSNGKTPALNWYKDYRYFVKKYKAASKNYITDYETRELAKSYIKYPMYFLSSSLTAEQRNYFANAPLPERYMMSVDKIVQTKMVPQKVTNSFGETITQMVPKEYVTYRRKAAPKKKLDKYTKPGNMRKEITELMLPKLKKLLD